METELNTGAAGSCHGNGEATQRLTSRKLRFSLLFLLFSVSLVPKISQILNTTIPDTSLAVFDSLLVKLVHRNGLVSSYKSVSILAVFRGSKLG